MFLFYETQAKELKLGILDLDFKSTNADLPFPAHDHVTAKAFQKEFLLNDNTWNQRLSEGYRFNLMKRSNQRGQESILSEEDEYFLLTSDGNFADIFSINQREDKIL